MKNFEKTTYSKAEKRYLSIIFFLFGISIMSLAPRTPDLKSNLAVNNGTFGTLLGSASIGSIVMLLIGGQIVHTIGAKRAMQIGSTVIALTYIALVSTSSPIIFLICNILAGSGVSIFHIASSGHSLHRQDEVGKVLVPKLHGAWAAGAMSTAAVAFLISNQISITSHISTLMVCFWVATQTSLRKLTPTFPKKPAADDSYRASSVKQFKFKINWFLSLGFFCASIMEFTIADWATLLGKEELGMGSSVATLSYLIYLIGLIIGRYSIGWALKHQSEQFWIKTGGLVGGVGLSSMLFTASVVVDINKNLGFFIAFLGFFLAGLGSSALAPIFFSIAGRLSNGKNALAVAQLSFVNTFVIFVAKNILAWIVQISSIMIALVITSILMAALLYFGRVGSADRQ